MRTPRIGYFVVPLALMLTQCGGTATSDPATSSPAMLTAIHVAADGSDSAQCGAPSSPCRSPTFGLQRLKDSCAAGTSTQRYALRLRSGHTYRAPQGLDLSCDNLTVESYRVERTAGAPPRYPLDTDCFEQRDERRCATLTAAQNVDANNWPTQKVAGTTLRYHDVCVAERPGVFDAAKMFNPPPSQAGSARLPEVRDNRAHLYTTLAAGQKQALQPGEWGVEILPTKCQTAAVCPNSPASCRPLNQTKRIFYNDNFSTAGERPQQLEISTANYVLNTAGKHNIELRYLDIYGSAWNQLLTPRTEKGRHTATLLISESSDVSVHHVRVAGAPMHALSVGRDSRDVSIRDTDVAFAGLWCLDVRQGATNVNIERVAAHHCGNNRGDQNDGHGFGLGANSFNVSVRDSVAYENTYSGGFPKPAHLPIKKRGVDYRKPNSAFVVYSSAGATVHNNVIACNWRGGFELGGHSPDSTISANRIVGNGRYSRYAKQRGEPLDRSFVFPFRVLASRGIDRYDNICRDRKLINLQLLDNEIAANYSAANTAANRPALSIASSVLKDARCDGLRAAESMIDVTTISGNRVCHNRRPENDRDTLQVRCTDRPAGTLSVAKARGEADNTSSDGSSCVHKQDWRRDGCSDYALPRDAGSLQQCLSAFGVNPRPWVGNNP